MVYIYLIAAGILLPIINGGTNILDKGYSWWLAPIIYVGLFLGFVIIHICLLVFTFALIDPKSPPEKGTRFYRFILNSSLPLMLWMAKVKVKLSGLDPEEIPNDEKMLFVCNHLSELDPIILMSVFPEHNIGFVGKKDICTKMPLIAKSMRKLYGVFVDRENDREAAKSIIEASHILKDQKASVGLFPEGYTNKGSQLLPFRNGSFKIALKAKAPIVVCAIHNTRILPKRILRRKTVVELKIVDLIYPHEYEGMNTAELGDMIHEKMDEAYKELRKRP